MTDHPLSLTVGYTPVTGEVGDTQLQICASVEQITWSDYGLPRTVRANRLCVGFAELAEE